MNLDTFLFLDSLWFRFFAGFIIGAVLGSFTGVLSYRLPRHLSIVFPRSHCLSCNAILNARDLVPIFSWLLTKGLCRHCGAKIGLQCLIIEIATSLLCAVATTTIGFSFWLVFAYAAIVGTTAFIAHLFSAIH